MYDSDITGLRALLAEWNSPSDYGTRQSRLRSGGGLNGSYVLTSDTVQDDDAIDHLVGSSGRDWFFARLTGFYRDLLFDRNSSESIN